jgi:predicted acyl esterase
VTRILIALLTALALAAGSFSSAFAASPATAAKAPKCKTAKQKRTKACKKAAAKKKKSVKCKKGYVKKTVKRGKKRTTKCVKKPLPKPVAPKPPAAGTSTAPIDYTKIAGLSQPTFSEIQSDAVEVPAHDGINLYVEVHRPKGADKVPVIFEASGYHGTLYERDGTRILPDPKGPDGKPLGLKGYFVPRGYAVVMLDVRGTGRSEGCLDHLGQNDLSDIKTVIEWAASQPWSNGNVGMTGHSYVGGTTNVGGASGAKGLKTIVPSASLASMYDHQFQGGVPFYLQWAGPIEAYENLALSADLPPGIPDPSGQLGGKTGDNFGNDPQYTGCGYTNSAATAGPDQATGQYNATFHAPRDHREGVKNANIPIFMNHGTVDQAARIGGSTWFFERAMKPGDKLWIGQWDHGIGSGPTRRGMQWTYALLAWFDKHLKGMAVDTGPPLEVFLNDETSDSAAFVAQGQILSGPDMPQTKPYRLFARNEEGLNVNPAEPGSTDFVGDAQGFTDNEATQGATFQTAPFAEDKVFFGLPKLTLNVSVTSPQVSLIGTLFAVDEAGLRRRLTQCAVNPMLRDGVDKVSPVVPSQAMSIVPPCFAMAYQVRKGQSLRLRITTSDPDKVPMFTQDPNVSVKYGGLEGTQIDLPEVVGGATLYQDTIELGDTSGDANSSG